MAAETGRDAPMTSAYRVTRGWAGGGMRGDTGSPRRTSMALVDTFTGCGAGLVGLTERCLLVGNISVSIIVQRWLNLSFKAFHLMSA
jgi:hypothetical protein